MSLWTAANRISVLRFAIFRMWRPVRDFLLSNLEALRYLFRRRDAIHGLEEIRRDLIFIEDLTFWYGQRHFEWQNDPVGGWLDFVSKPWVSVAKNHGDCDDMMAIAEFALAPHIDEGHRASAYSNGGSGHAMYVARTGSEWTLVSNQRVRRGFKTALEAVRSFYGDDTAFMYIYGVGYFGESE